MLVDYVIGGVVVFWVIFDFIIEYFVLYVYIVVYDVLLKFNIWVFFLVGGFE